MKISTIYRLIAALLISAVSQHSYAESATWSQNPINNSWNTAENWMPVTIPNGASDVATLGPSDVTEISIPVTVEVSSIQFMPGALSFTINVGDVDVINHLLISGSGIVNDSGTAQSFTDGVVGGFRSSMFFTNSASAGKKTFFGGEGNQFFFSDLASAGSGTFSVKSGGIIQGAIDFFDNSTAADANIEVSNFAIASFGDTTTAANAVFTAIDGGDIAFGTNSTAGNAHVTISAGGGTEFTQSATAAQGDSRSMAPRPAAAQPDLST